ncbi:hypothetical protein Zmor_004484, partial [Zophobas morio]
ELMKKLPTNVKLPTYELGSMGAFMVSSIASSALNALVYFHQTFSFFIYHCDPFWTTSASGVSCYISLDNSETRLSFCSSSTRIWYFLSVITKTDAI